MQTYRYNGPVMEFDRLIAERWSGETTASSEKKARCNLAYQFKKQYRKGANAKISLPGVCTIINKEEEHP